MSAPRLDTYQTDSTPISPAPEPLPSRNRPGGSVLWMLSAVLAAVAAVMVLRTQERAAPVAAPTTSAPPAQPAVVAASGEMQPLRQVKISPEVSGEIIELPVKEGQQVKKGDLLMKIKPDFYVANRNQAEGSYKSALANVAIARAHLKRAEAELKRNLDLSRSKLVSESAFEEVEAACEVARAQVGNAEGQSETARAALVKAQYDLDQTTIRSPINGTVAKLNSAVGERVVGTATMAGTEVMTLANLNNMEARVQVGEGEIGLIGCGQKVQLALSAFPGRSYTGTVQEIAASSDTYGVAGQGGERKTARFEVRIRLQEPQHFRPGMSVTARIQTVSVSGMAGPGAPRDNGKSSV